MEKIMPAMRGRAKGIRNLPKDTMHEREERQYGRMVDFITKIRAGDWDSCAVDNILKKMWMAHSGENLTDQFISWWDGLSPAANKRVARRVAKDTEFSRAESDAILEKYQHDLTQQRYGKT
jgi:hypothetical protein